MIPIISEPRQILLAGMSFYGDPFDIHAGWDEENRIGELWNRWMRFLYHNPFCQNLAAEMPGFYEVHLYDEDTAEKGLFEVFVGIAIKESVLHKIPENLCLKNLPESNYAIFTLQGMDIKSDWENTIQLSLLESGLQRNDSYNFQYYDERFKGIQHIESSILDVYIPIKNLQ